MSPPRLINAALASRMAEVRRAEGKSVAAIAAAFGFSVPTTRRALARLRLSERRRKAAPLKVRCQDATRPLLAAEAAKLGMRPAALAAQLLDLVLQGNLVAAVRDEG